jgi:hypothetical protein
LRRASDAREPEYPFTADSAEKLQTEPVVQLRVMRGGASFTCRAVKEKGAKEKPEFAP